MTLSITNCLDSKVVGVTSCSTPLHKNTKPLSLTLSRALSLSLIRSIIPSPASPPHHHHLLFLPQKLLNLASHLIHNHSFPPNPSIFHSSMASSSSPLPKPVAPQIKRLSDLLQEQQEPFLLDVYLLERGYGNKILNSKCRDKKKKINPLGPKLLRCIFNKLTSVTYNRKLSKCNSTRTNAGHQNHQVSEFDQFSSATSTTLSESCSESDIEEVSQSYQQQQPCSSSSANRDQQAPTDRSRTNQWGCIEADSKQHSPVSVLDHELHFDEASPLHIHSKAVPSSSRTSKKKIPSTSSSKKLTEKSIFSASLWELLVQSLVEKQGIIGITEVQELLGTSSSSSISSQYLKTKRVLEQTKQLLFDCVREAVKTHRSKGRCQQRCITDILGSEELGKIICEQICSWGKQSGNLTNITHLLKSDFWVSKEEWSDFQLETREIGMDIGDAILDDISNEIVTDMVDCFLH